MTVSTSSPPLNTRNPAVGNRSSDSSPEDSDGRCGIVRKWALKKCADGCTLETLNLLATIALAIVTICMALFTDDLGSDVHGLEERFEDLNKSFAALDQRVTDLKKQADDLEKRLAALSTDSLNASITQLEDSVMDLRETTDDALDEAIYFRNLLNYSASMRKRMTSLEVMMQKPTYASFDVFEYFPTLNRQNEIFQAGYTIPDPASVVGKFIPLADRSGLWTPIPKRDAIFFYEAQNTSPAVGKSNTKDAWEAPGIAQLPVGPKGILLMPGNDVNSAIGICYRVGASGFALIKASSLPLSTGKANISVVLQDAEEDTQTVLEFRVVHGGASAAEFFLPNIEVETGDRILFLISPIGSNAGSAQCAYINVTLTPGKVDIPEPPVKDVFYDVVSVTAEENLNNPIIQLGYTNGKSGERNSSFHPFGHVSNALSNHGANSPNSPNLAIFTKNGIQTYPVMARSSELGPWNFHPYPSLPPGSLYLHPGSAESGREVGFKYVVRKQGFLQINATFQSLNHGRKRIGVFLYQPGQPETELKSHLIAGRGALSLTFLENVAVRAGDEVFFVVDWQEDIDGDSTLCFVEVALSPDAVMSNIASGGIYPYGTFKLSEHFPVTDKENTQDAVFQLGYADETMPFQKSTFTPFTISATTWGGDPELLVFAKSSDSLAHPVIARGNPADFSEQTWKTRGYSGFTMSDIYLHPGNLQEDGLVGFRFPIRAAGKSTVRTKVTSLNHGARKLRVIHVSGNGGLKDSEEEDLIGHMTETFTHSFPSVLPGDDLYIMLDKHDDYDGDSTLFDLTVTLEP